MTDSTHDPGRCAGCQLSACAGRGDCTSGSRRSAQWGRWPLLLPVVATVALAAVLWWVVRGLPVRATLLALTWLGLWWTAPRARPASWWGWGCLGLLGGLGAAFGAPLWPLVAWALGWAALRAEMRQAAAGLVLAAAGVVLGSLLHAGALAAPALLGLALAATLGQLGAERARRRVERLRLLEALATRGIGLEDGVDANS